MKQVDDMITEIFAARDPQEWAHDNVDKIADLLRMVRTAWALNADAPMTARSLSMAIDSLPDDLPIYAEVDGEAYAVTGGSILDSGLMLKARKKRPGD